MGRWQPGAQARLRQAALELYAEQGFERTTVAEVAGRAGLTERTFFRYFADKREVLFAGQETMVDLVLGGLRDAPRDLAPLDVVARGLAATAEMFGGPRDGARMRQQVIEANVELRERELTKFAALAAELSNALRARGVDDLAADLAAETGVAVFRLAWTAWLGDPAGRGLDEHVRRAVGALRTIVEG